MFDKTLEALCVQPIGCVVEQSQLGLRSCNATNAIRFRKAELRIERADMKRGKIFGKPPQDNFLASAVALRTILPVTHLLDFPSYMALHLIESVYHAEYPE